MELRYLVLALQLTVLTQAAALSKDENPDKQDKTLIMLEIEPVTGEERSKRSSEQDAQRYIRQSASLPPEYLGLLQQLSAQQQATAGSPSQQQLIQELVVAREGAQQAPAAARYVLSHDGRLLEQNIGLSALGQAPPQPQTPPPPPGRPILSPELEAFSRLQMQLQQDYHDAPIRAQIAGLTTRPLPTAPQTPPPAGPDSQAPQVFSQASVQAAARHQARLQAQLQGQDPNLVYGGVPSLDTQSLLQQQLAQLSLPGQPDARQLASLFAQSQPAPATPQPFLYQQVRPDFEQQKIVYQQPQPQAQLRRPAALAPSSQAQLQPQNTLQAQAQPQYLIETTRTAKPQTQLEPSALPQFIPSEIPQQSQIQYVDFLRHQQPATAAAPSPGPAPQPESYVSTLLQPTSGRGLFTPVKQPSRSSIYVSRAGSPKSSGITVEEVVAPDRSAPQKLPVVRLPTPPGQRPLTRGELDALLSAGFNVTPLQAEETDAQPGFFKSKRQQPLNKDSLKKNHVVYQNHGDGVSYQYSPGGGSPKPKKAYSLVPGDKKEHLKNVYRVEADRSDRQLVTYVLALGSEPVHTA